MAKVSPVPADRLAEFAQEFERTAKSRRSVRYSLAPSGLTPGLHAP